MIKYILAITIILAATFTVSAQTLKLPAIATPVTDAYPARTMDEFSDSRVIQVTRIRRAPQAQAIVGFMRDGSRQRADWWPGKKLTFLPGRLKNMTFGQGMHIFAATVGFVGLSSDGASSVFYNRVVIKNITTGAVTVIEEGNPLFRSSGGGFRSKKYVFAYGIPIMLGSEVARVWCASCADMTEIFFGGFGLRNALDYHYLTHYNYVIVGKLPAPTGK